MIKTVDIYKFEKGGPSTWYPDRCYVGCLDKYMTLETNTDQIVHSKLVQTSYVESYTKIKKTFKYWLFFSENVISFDLVYKDVEYYLTTFSDGSRIITLEKLIGEII